MEQYIITIAREFGSRGREIAKKLGNTLGIPVYDKDIVRKGAYEAGYIDESYKDTDKMIEDKLNGLDTGKVSFRSSNAKILYGVQASAVKKLAQKGSCIFVGRCADYVLEGNPNCINIFIYAPYSERYYHLLNEYGLTEEETKKMMERVDRARHDYYKAFTEKNRGERQGKHIMIDASAFDIDATVQALKMLIESRFGKRE